MGALVSIQGLSISYLLVLLRASLLGVCFGRDLGKFRACFSSHTTDIDSLRLLKTWGVSTSFVTKTWGVFRPWFRGILGEMSHFRTYFARREGFSAQSETVLLSFGTISDFCRKFEKNPQVSQ